MFGIAWSELLVILVVALVVMNPKDIPAVIKTVRDFMHKLQELKREMMTVLHEIDHAAGISDAHGSLKKEADSVNQQLRQIVDLDGNLQDAYDLSDIMPELKTDQLVAKLEAPADESIKKSTIH